MKGSREIIMERVNAGEVRSEKFVMSENRKGLVIIPIQGSLVVSDVLC